MRKVVIFGFLMTVSAHVVLADSSQNEYYVTALKAPTGTSKLQSFYGTSVNDSGEVLGFAFFDDSLGGVAFRWTNNVPTQLRNIDGTGFEAGVMTVAINDIGGGIGQGYNSSGYPRGIVWSNGRPDELIPLADRFYNCPSEATALDNLGNVIGWSYPACYSDPSDNVIHGVKWVDGSTTMVDLGTYAPGQATVPTAISPNGKFIAGQGSDNTSTVDYVKQIPISYTSGKWTQLIPLPGARVNGYVVGVNDAGQIIGHADTTECQTSNISNDPYHPIYETDCNPHVVLWQNGRITDVGTLGGAVSYGRGIDAAGDVIGVSYIKNNSASHPFMWRQGKMTDLATYLADRLPKGLLADDVVSISKSGTILLTGTDSKSHVRSYYIVRKLVPVHMTITSNLPSAPYGKQIHLVAKITTDFGKLPANYGVYWYDGTSYLGASGTTSIGTASWEPSTWAPGVHNITVKAGEYDPFAPVISPAFKQTITVTSTKTVLSTNTTSITHGQAVKLTATVVPAYGSIAGSVTFKDGSSVLGSASVDSRTKQATLQPVLKVARKYSITASYGGTVDFAASSSAAVTVTVR